MVWISDPVNRRTYDPENKFELFIEGSSSNNDTYYRINGDAGWKVTFSAGTRIDNLSDKERLISKMDDSINDSDIIIKIVRNGKIFSEEIKNIISGALCSHKFSYGKNFGEAVFLVSFGVDGEIYRG